VALNAVQGYAVLRMKEEKEVYDPCLGASMETRMETKVKIYCRWALAGLVILCMAGLSAAVALAATNPVPLINQPLAPDAVAPGGPGFTVTVHGTGFVTGSVVYWDGSARATSFVSNSTLTASILSSDIASAGTGSVTVVNAAPGGGTSNIVFLQVSVPVSAVTFNRADLPGGNSPNFVGSADLNGDGILDFVLLNSNVPMVAVYLGNGDGSFQAPVDYATGAGPIWVAFGDFNGDGIVDLAVADLTDETISILLGNGNGTFGPRMTFAIGNSPYEVITADFNKDGKLDLAVVQNNVPAVAILLGNGDGTFQPLVNYATGSDPVSLVTGDFNGDGNLDLAVANYDESGTVSLLLGNGNGTFQSQVQSTVGEYPYAIQTADFNGDNKLDLAVTSGASNSASVLIGNGDGTF